MGAKAEITASVPAGVHWRASPEGMPLWGPNRFWPGSGLVLRCLGPGFTVLALGPGFRPIFIFIQVTMINYEFMTLKESEWWLPALPLLAGWRLARYLPEPTLQILDESSIRVMMAELQYIWTVDRRTGGRFWFHRIRQQHAVVGYAYFRHACVWAAQQPN